jgi:hypothetical protein
VNAARRALVAQALLVFLASVLPGCLHPQLETSRYARHELDGFHILVSPQATVHDKETSEALSLLHAKLVEFRGRVPSAVYQSLCVVPIWIEYKEAGRAMAGYHGMKWVSSHGLNPDKARCIEIADLRAFVTALRGDKPMALVHELAHAYLDRVLGNRDPVTRAYTEAVRSGKYEHVRTRRGTVERAYALASVDEYFAELTEAYLGENDYEPFDRDGLARFDPQGFALMRSIWG